MLSELAGHAPQTWARRPIEEVCTRVTSGGTPSRTNKNFYKNGQWPWVKTQELRDCWLEKTEEYITNEAISQSSAKVLPEQTILLALYGATVGQLGILRRAMTCNQACCAMIVNQKKADYRYLYYALLASRPQLKGLASGAAQQNLSGKLIREYLLPFPELAHQHRIAHILGTLDDKIELNRRMNETLEALARAIFKSWFVDFDPVRAQAEGRKPSGMNADTAALFPASFVDSPLGKIPKGWKVKSIGELARCVGGGTPSTKNPEYWLDGNHPFATPRDMSRLESKVILDTERHITDAGVKCISSRKLPVGTVLLSSRAPIGYLAIAETSVSINQGFIAMICDGPLPNYYILFWVAENMDTILNNAGGTTFAEISKSNFRPIPALLPSQNVLERFVDMVQPLHKKIVQNLLENKNLINIRDTLLPKLLSGEISIKDNEKFVEASK